MAFTKRSTTPSQEAEIVRLYRDEKYGKKAASKIVFGVERPMVVSRILKEHGISTRTEKEGKKASVAYQERKTGPKPTKRRELERLLAKTKRKVNKTSKCSDLELFAHGNKVKVREGYRERYQQDSAFRSLEVWRARFTKIVGPWRNTTAFYRQSRRMVRLLGCSPDELKQWIENQFEDGMTWDNSGEYWDIDHIVPCSWFDHDLPYHLEMCWNFRNLRPLTKEENSKRGNSGAGMLEALTSLPDHRITMNLITHAISGLECMQNSGWSLEQFRSYRSF